MKKLFLAGLLCAWVCVCASGAADTLFNVYLTKETLTEQETMQRNIHTKPDGLKVTRQSVIPWDEEGSRWSVLVELENVSEETIVIDDTWLIACDTQRKELARWNVPAMDGAFWRTGNAVRPKERVVLFAGTDEVKTWIQNGQSGELIEQTVQPAGLSAFAGKIRQADLLRVRLSARTVSEPKEYTEQVEEAKAWIADGKLCLEISDTRNPETFTALNVVLTDREGRMLDALQDSAAGHEGMLRDGRFYAEKTLAPYVDEQTAQTAEFEVSGRKKSAKKR